MTEAETAWLAGILEGEAYFGPQKPRKGEYVRLSMTDVDIIERVAALTGVGYLGWTKPRQPHHKPQRTWSLAKASDALPILKAIRPWLGIRRGIRVDEAITVATTIAARRSCGSTVCQRGHDLGIHGLESQGQLKCRECARLSRAVSRAKAS